MKNVESEILNTTVLELTKCDNKTFERRIAVVSELKSLNMTSKNHFTLVSGFVCTDELHIDQKSSLKTKNSHNFCRWRTRMLVIFTNESVEIPNSSFAKYVLCHKC